MSSSSGLQVPTPNTCILNNPPLDHTGGSNMLYLCHDKVAGIKKSLSACQFSEPHLCPINLQAERSMTKALW